LGEPTYWPTMIIKMPDLIDFCIIKGLLKTLFECKSCSDLSSDHSPVLTSLSTKIMLYSKPCKLYNNRTDWDCFQRSLVSFLSVNHSLKNDSDIEEAIGILITVFEELLGILLSRPPTQNLSTTFCLLGKK